jgi:hypothetical protein
MSAQALFPRHAQPNLPVARPLGFQPRHSVERSSICDTHPQGWPIVNRWDIPDSGVFVNLDAIFRDCAAAVAYKGNDRKIRPQGTAFFISHDTGLVNCIYAITARHVVDGAGKGCQLWYAGKNGTREKLQVPQSEWFQHQDLDIAICPVDADIPVTRFPSRALRNQEFNGLISYIHSGKLVATPCMVTSEANFIQPVARFGHIARPNMTMRLEFCGEKRVCTVHAIECMAWGGQSGAPVFSFDDRVERETRPENIFSSSFGAPVTDNALDLKPRILGLIHGCIPSEFEIHKDKFAQLNNGISVVIPGDDILTFLNEVADKTVEMVRPIPL